MSDYAKLIETLRRMSNTFGSNVSGDAADAIEALQRSIAEYEQTTLGYCEKCGWRTVHPDDGCLNCRIAELEAQLAHSNEMRVDNACSAGTWKSIAEERLDYIAELESQISAIRKAVEGHFQPHNASAAWFALKNVQAILNTINAQGE